MLVALLLAFAPSAWALGWGLPTGSSDEGPVSGNNNIPWTNLANAFDAGTSPPIGNYSSTYATNSNNAGGKQVGNYADFTFPAAYCDSIGVYSDFGSPTVDYVQIDVWNTAGAGSWQTICGSTPLTGTFPANGVISNDTWTVIPFTAITISKIRFRFHYTASGYAYWLWDIAYHSIPFVPTAPTVATFNADVDLNSAVLQGQIVNDGGLVCTAKFEYGTTTSYELGVVPVVPAGTTYNAGMTCGAFLGGLTTGQTYHYRIDATNSVGTTQGADVTFTPAAPGTGWWVDATGDSADPSPPANAQQWQNRVAAYDDDDQTFATLSVSITDTSPTTYLYLTHNVALTCDKVRFKASTSAAITDIQIWINTVASGWIQIATVTTYTDQQWYEVPFTKTDITGARLRLDLTTGSGFLINIADFDSHIVGVQHCYGFVDSAFSGANK